jgi:hypothetical protein
MHDEGMGAKVVSQGKEQAMRIGLSHMDPQIAQAVEDRLCAPANQYLKDDILWGGFNPLPFRWEFQASGIKVTRKRDPTKEERRAFQLRKSRDELVTRRALTTAFAPLLCGAALGGIISMVEPWAGVTIGLLCWLGGTGAGIWWTSRVTHKRSLQYEVLLDEMRAVFPLLSLTPAERAYCDTLLLVARMDPNQEARRTIRQTIKQLNELMESSRQLETRRQSLLPVLGSNVIAELEAEYSSLDRRLEQAQDSLTRQSLQQSLQMCATRLENARAFEQALERINAQQEAIVHALKSAQSALARMQVAPSPQTEMAAHEISETVEQMNQQTHAVEQAVQEVMTLRTQ